MRPAMGICSRAVANSGKIRQLTLRVERLEAILLASLGQPVELLRCGSCNHTEVEHNYQGGSPCIHDLGPPAGDCGCSHFVAPK